MKRQIIINGRLITCGKGEQAENRAQRDSDRPLRSVQIVDNRCANIGRVVNVSGDARITFGPDGSICVEGGE